MIIPRAPATDGLREIAQQMETIGNLNRVRRSVRGGIGVSPPSIPSHGLHAGMRAALLPAAKPRAGLGSTFGRVLIVGGSSGILPQPVRLLLLSPQVTWRNNRISDAMHIIRQESQPVNLQDLDDLSGQDRGSGKMSTKGATNVKLRLQSGNVLWLLLLVLVGAGPALLVACCDQAPRDAAQLPMRHPKQTVTGYQFVPVKTPATPATLASHTAGALRTVGSPVDRPIFSSILCPRRRSV